MQMHAPGQGLHPSAATSTPASSLFFLPPDPFSAVSSSSSPPSFSAVDESLINIQGNTPLQPITTAPQVVFAVGSHGPVTGDGYQRERTMSQSSTERDVPNDVKGERKARAMSLSDESQPNPKKRPSIAGDAVDYPRRRATIACEICRSRKSRCDGNRPKCRLCTELNAECVYREPGIKLDAGDKLILERLSHIESLIQTNLLAQTGNVGVTTPSPAASNSTVNDEHLARTHGAGAGTMHSNGIGTWTSATMPKNHTTPALNLLRWPKIRDLVSQRWDPQILVQLEMSREPLPLGTTRPPVDLSNSTTAAYVKAFFERVNVWYACVNPYTWHSTHRKALAQHFREGTESCIVLLVLALGCASSAGSISQYPPKNESPGYSYFATAWNLLPAIMARNDIASAQCQILASAYFFYMVRPLEAWNLLASVSMKLQLLFNAVPLPAGVKQLSERVYWNTLLFERYVERFTIPFHHNHHNGH